MARKNRTSPVGSVATPPFQALKCRNCASELRSAAEVGWECECGVVVCAEPACVEEYFKFVADGEATRCRSCGLLM